ncbi:MAG: 3-phosphoglycerate dehydrogenase [Oscillospiraceae bacterium]|nr:3-phosphoglycerate dehydrogenase [Oscillospiraceae bacterium]
MFNIQTLNKIAACGTDIFDKSKYTIADEVQNPDAIMVRSAKMLDMEFAPNLLAIARAGAGVNNIPVEKCAEQGIVVFNTPGANANGVKELAVAGMLLASRDVIGGANWVQANKSDPDIAKSVEKNKSQFAGTEIKGKTLGIIGLGAIGGPLGNAALSLGMKVLGCDPYISIDAAWNLSENIQRVKTREEIFKNSDYISLHTPLVVNDDPGVNTKHMINKDTIAMMKDGVIVMNFARDTLVDDDAMEAALKSGKVRCYITDFPNEKTANMAGVIAIPHLGASTEESEDNCAVMAANELIEYLENGNIINSVNFPNAEMNAAGTKICILHKNIPDVISKITSILGDAGLNIDNMVSKSKKDFAYMLLDVAGNVSDDIVSKLTAAPSVIKIRVIK